MKPVKAWDESTFGQVDHVTIGSGLFGFIDDMYIVSEPFGLDSSQRELKVQSQLRIGSGDIGANYDHVKEFLDCMNAKYDNFDSSPRPCSLS